MKNTVVIKGNKSGMTVILDPEAAYETLLLDIAAKITVIPDLFPLMTTVFFITDHLL